MRKIAVKRNDGGVSIIIPTHEATPELLLRDALACEGYLSHREIDDFELSQDRYFRNAWMDNGKLDIDPVKALEIKKEKLRALRKPKLEELDVEFMRAVELGDAILQSYIAKKKQILRDVTLNLPTDLVELRDYMPDCLKLVEVLDDAKMGDVVK
jgi:hypothetical protein